MHTYLSDRLPELIGRGGFLLHPYVDGVTDGTVFTDGEHLATWKLGTSTTWIDRSTTTSPTPTSVTESPRPAPLTCANLTYTVRLKAVLEAVQ